MRSLTRRIKRRRGFTLVETIAALAIMSLLMIAIGRVAAIKLSDQDSIDAQYDVIAADAYFADIYNDFHSCVRFTFDETLAGNVQLTFHQLDGGINVYGYYPGSGDCQKNGVHMFDAQNMIVQGAGNNLVVSIKLPDERLLEMSIFR